MKQGAGGLRKSENKSQDFGQIAPK